MDMPFAAYPFTATKHMARLPPLQAGRDAQRRPVVIVGAGPVGYCAALGLARHGVPVLLLEADDGVCFGSRAICISRRSLEIIDRLGALPGFLAEGLPWTGGRSFYRHQEVLHFTMPTDDLQRLPPMLNLAQYSIEQLLLDRAEQCADLIEIRWQARVTALSARDDGVTLAVSTPAGRYEVDADWVVAADGGRSFVREALGLQLEGTSYEGRYVIVDILMDSPRPTERLAYFDPPCNPGSTVLVHKQPHNVWRIDYQLRDGEDPEAAVLPQNVLPRVASLLEMMGERGPWQPVWTGLYKAHALTLPRYRAGRVLLAGDAAHLVPIFGVRGANSGIDDADNLAWKLAWVIQGKADECLLDSYSHERVAAAHENLRQGRKSTEFMAPPSFAFELMRTAVLSLAAGHPPLRSLINPRQTSAIAYADSPLNAADAAADFAAGPAPGTVLAECPVLLQARGDASPRPAHLTEVLSQPGAPGFTALVFAAGEADAAAAARAFAPLRTWLAGAGIGWRTVAIGATGSTAADAIDVGLSDPGARLAALYDARPGSVYLVRPDGHVLGRWRTVDPAAVLAAIQRVTGHAPSTATTGSPP